MATTPVQLIRNLVDDAGNPITSLVATATLLGGNAPIITGNGDSIVVFTRQGATSSGAQSTGPAAPSSLVARVTGGAMADGVYDYLWTFFDGSESLVGTVATTTIATSGANTGSTVQTMPALPQGAIYATCYRQKDSSGTFYQVVRVDDLTKRTFIDTQVESSITGNPSPSGSALPAGQLTFLLMAPADISDLINGSAIFSYKVVIGSQTYYTTNFAYSGSPIDLSSVLAAAPSAGIMTQIWWIAADPSEGPVQGAISSFRISQDCFASDTGDALLARFPATNAAAGGSTSQGYGTLFLKPNAETTQPTGFYYYQLTETSDIFTVQVPMPNLGTHPNGFEISELAPVLVGPPGAVVINLANVQAVTTELDTPLVNPLTISNTAEDEMVNLRDIVRVDKGLAATHWRDPRATITTTGSGTIGGDLAVAGAFTATVQATSAGPIAAGTFLRAPHLGGYPVSKHVTLATASAAGTGATISTPISSGTPLLLTPGLCFAGDMFGNFVALTTGTGSTAGKVATITLHDVLTQEAATCIVQGCDAATNALRLRAVENAAGTAIDIYADTAPDDSTAYLFKYGMWGI